MLHATPARAQSGPRICTRQVASEDSAPPVKTRIVTAVFRDNKTVSVTGWVALKPLSAVVAMDLSASNGAFAITRFNGPVETPPDCPKCRAQHVSTSPNNSWTLLNVWRSASAGGKAGYEIWLRGRRQWLQLLPASSAPEFEWRWTSDSRYVLVQRTLSERIYEHQVFSLNGRATAVNGMPASITSGHMTLAERPTRVVVMSTQNNTTTLIAATLTARRAGAPVVVATNGAQWTRWDAGRKVLWLIRPTQNGLLVFAAGVSESYLLRGADTPGDAFAVSPAGAAVFMNTPTGEQLWRCATPDAPILFIDNHYQ